MPLPIELKTTETLFDIAYKRAQSLKNTDTWQHNLAQLIAKNCQHHPQLNETYVSADGQEGTKMFFADNQTHICASVAPDSIFVVDPDHKQMFSITRHFTDQKNDKPVVITHYQFHTPTDLHYGEKNYFHSRESERILKRFNLHMERTPKPGLS